MMCAKHLCSYHLQSVAHTCPSYVCRRMIEESLDHRAKPKTNPPPRIPHARDPEAYYPAYASAKARHLSALLARIKVDALQSAASKARNNIPCRVPALSNHLDPAARAKLVSSQCGGQNCHVDIEFADGVTWLARIRLDDPLLPPPAVQSSIFLSEVATLEFLARTRVPAPRVYGYALGEAPGNEVGVSYVLIEKMKGTPLDWGSAGTEEREKVMEQLAEVYMELERHPIPMTGSLFPGSGGEEPGVGVFAQTPCFETPERGLGPFETLDEAYTDIIHQQLRTIASREVSSLPVDNYLAFHWRLEVLPKLLAGSASREGPFYLKHYGDKGDHILVDEEYNITGIIDWEFASAEAKELAFSSPCMMWPVAKLYDGDDALAEDEVRFADIFERRGRGNLAEMVRGGRRWQRYLFFLGGGMPAEMDDFEALFQGLRKSFMGDGEGEVVHISSYSDWKPSALGGVSKGDHQLQALIQDERARGRGVKG